MQAVSTNQTNRENRAESGDRTQPDGQEERNQVIQPAIDEYDDQKGRYRDQFLGEREVVDFSIVGAAPKYCLSAPISREQSRDVVTRYLRANPKELYRPADTLVGVALTATFPCPKGK